MKQNSVINYKFSGKITTFIPTAEFWIISKLPFRGPWSSFSPMGEFVECGDLSPHGSESGDKSPHSTFGGLNDDQGPFRVKQTGVAMVIVLWMVSLLTIMAASFSLSTQRNTGLVNNAKERARGLALADAGVNYALIMLSLPDPVKRWRSDGTDYQVALPGGEVGITIFDESGKIDINSASEQTLNIALGKLTGNIDQAASLTDIILDWRDSDDLNRLRGAEAKDYLAADKGYVPQNKNFQALEELQMVLGMPPALYKKLEPLLTIYTGQDGINPQKASAEALRLFFNMDEKAVADFLNMRSSIPPNMPVPTLSVPPGGVPMVNGGDTAYTIYARSRTGEGSGAGLKVIARRQFSRNNGAPFAFLSWKQQIFGSDQNSTATPSVPR
ncbi:MAG: general secretion pathway protein GspK [Candidatus Methylumidiphilus alinenensis]|uniref:General secretion pathway protein GspK n=1 Tax=Candidatus Methylumidiphilus alinenensis TaxID=2202197 RepID=A0A2W4SV15_9GAMM|nr:MAG: general secretion pathway protein GspK [Candidatus Methylumidiphilus alinenensis]